MKNNLIYILLIVSSFSLKATETPLLWKLFQQSSVSSKSANELYLISKNFDTDNNPLLIGYKGISNMMLCNHVFSPINKLNHFKEGKKLLELAINKDSLLVELRFFRYSCQVKAPAMLGYNLNIQTDKKFLLEFLQSTPLNSSQREIAINIKDFMLSCNNLSLAEKNKLREISF